MGAYCKQGTKMGPLAVFGLVLALILPLVTPTEASAQKSKGWVLLCSSENQLQGLTRRAASRLFLRRSEMVVSGRKVEPVNLESLEQRLAFLSTLTRLTPSLVERHFMELKFRREGDWPPMVAGPNQLMQKLREDPALIGWLPIETVQDMDDEALAGLHLLKLDGREFSSPEYALRPK